MVDLYAIVRRLTGCELITASDTKALTDAVDGLIAELEQVKQERDDAKQALQNEIVAHGNTIRGKAERLAGARVKATSDELSRYIERCRELSDGGEYSWWSRLAEILSALAEPAGEVEPVGREPFIELPDGSYERTTPPDASAIREALERGQAFANQVRAVTCHLNGQAYSSTVSALNYFDAALSRAALAGAKP